MGLSCVSGDQMRAFLAGELGEYDESVVVEHLDDCPNCERLAAELSDDREARKLARVNRRVAVPTATTPEVDDLCRRLHALGMLSMAVESADCDAADADGATTEVSASGSTATDWPTWQILADDDKKSGQPRLTRLGPYDVLRPLGAGSFGVVYLAEDRRLHRRVAIKVARASVLTDPTLRQRFFREAEALARLEHPHILSVYEADEIEGLCYLALAYCDGPTLDQWLEEQSGPLDPVFATQLMLPLVEAVEHAHSRGILHRDIKPANILLPAADATEPLPFNPKLTDFGLAKVIEEKGGQTLAGMVLGTVHYMAPEQAAGHAERIGPATDVYSLGAVLYQLITGRLPIEGNSTIDTLRRLLIDEPPEAGQIVKNIPSDLSAIVRKCLQKSPSQRYATAAELGDDLNRFLTGRPTKARPLATIERAFAVGSTPQDVGHAADAGRDRHGAIAGTVLLCRSPFALPVASAAGR